MVHACRRGLGGGGLLALLLLLTGAAPAQATHPSPLDSMQALLRRPDLADTTRVQVLDELCWSLIQTDLAASQRFGTAGVALAHRIGYTLGEARLLNDLGTAMYQAGDLQASLRYCTQALPVALRTGHPRLIGHVYLGLGNAAFGLTQRERAIAFFQQARQAYARHQPPALADEARVLNNLATLYSETGQLTKAAAHQREALRLARQVPDEDQNRPTMLFNLANIEEKQGHLSLARTLHEEVLALGRRQGDVVVQCKALSSLASLALAATDAPLALRYARQSAALARQVHSILELREALKVQSVALQRLGRLAAFDTLTRVRVLDSLMLNEQIAQSTAQAQARFDAAGKQAQIEQLKQQRRIQRLEADQQAVRTRLITASAVALALMLLGAAVLYLRLRRTSAALAISEALARAAEAEARRAVATKDQLMSIIGHDLRSPVATFQQVTPLLHHFADEPNPTAQHEIATALDANAHHLGALLDNLLYWARAEAGSLLNHPQALPVAAVLTEAAAPYTAAAHLKGVALTTAVVSADGNSTGDPTEPLLVAADPDLLRTVLRNLVSNAVKFTPKGGQIRLRAWVEAPGQVTLEVRDTGVGIAPDRAAALFSAGESVSTEGTAGEPGTGLGLPLSARFVQLLGSELRLVPPVAGQPGTAFCFELPLAAELEVVR